MSKGIRTGLLVVAAIVMGAAVGRSAFARGKDPSGNMNLRLEGYEVVAGTQVDILGIGQEIVDSAGSFLGDETFTYVNPTSATTAVCDGSISAGEISFQGGSFGTDGQGQFNISMTFTPTTAVTSTACQATVTTLLCNRTLLHAKFANDLNVGQYHCVATSVTVGGSAVGASLHGHLDIVSGSNGPTS